MLNIFIGVDPRQPIAYTVLQSSIITRSSEPVAITPLILHQLPIQRRGLTDFTFSRYLVPYLMEYRGAGLFLDADMLVSGDIAELFDLFDPTCSVQVVKGQQRFEWSSLMLFNCAQCQMLTPDFIEKGRPQDMTWGKVGSLPPEWNHCVGYDVPRDDAKLYHYTMGIPAFPETRNVGAADLWENDLRVACSTCSWQDLMAGSVHEAKLRELNNGNDGDRFEREESSVFGLVSGEPGIGAGNSDIGGH